MSTAYLDLLDTNLQLFSAGQALQSPGYALLEDSEYRFGADARSAARLHPRQINTRYWWQLSTEPLQPALGPARHTADLVHAHLLDLHRAAGSPQELVLAASGSMQRDQLALLLGIVQQCSFDVVGLVNRSTALGSLYGGTGRLFHLEIQLHQALLTTLNREAGDVSVERTVPLPGCGMLQLQERLVEIVAAAFIRQTRFDPRRKADTEQQLYDALPQTLVALQQQGETNLEVNGYRARINKSDLNVAGQRLFDSTKEALGTPQGQEQIIADPVASLLPGLGEHFQSIQVAPEDALHKALQQHGDRLLQREQALSFVAALPCLDPAEDTAAIAPTALEPVPVPVPVAQPTHLLRGTKAQPLVAGMAIVDGCTLARSERGWQLQGDSAAVSVNGETGSADTMLVPGDTLSTGGKEYAVLIEVL